MKNKQTREFITDAKISKYSKYFTIRKKANKNKKSFNITQNFLKALIARGTNEKKLVELIITMPANIKEDFILKCYLKKQPKDRL